MLDKFRSATSKSMLLLVVTLAVTGCFKLVAFLRESYTAANFGLSAATDVYFALQQLPLALATFMFGAFALAFTPAFARGHAEEGRVQWLPALVLWGSAAGVLLTALLVAATPVVLGAFVREHSAQGRQTLWILSSCLLPTIFIGFWAGIVMARGKFLIATTVTGMPYLAMAILLPLLIAIPGLGELALPASFAGGFAIVGMVAMVTVFGEVRRMGVSRDDLLGAPGLGMFLRQLGGSAAENIGFAVNQILAFHFLAAFETGTVSANSYAMRIGMLGLSLVALPVAQVFQGRLCTVDQHRMKGLFRQWLAGTAAIVMVTGLTILAVGKPLLKFLYMRGKFSTAELEAVADMLPCWIAYFVVMSLNAVLARYLFAAKQSSAYVRNMLLAYAAANLLRTWTAGHGPASLVVWCAVGTEACAFMAGLWQTTSSREAQSLACKPSGWETCA